MAAPAMGDGAPAESNAPAMDDRDKEDNKVEDSVGDGQAKTLTKKSQ
jgi:hypothetical protein